MSAAAYDSCNDDLRGERSRRDSSGTMQLLDRLGHGLVSLSFSSEVGGAGAATEDTAVVRESEQKEKPSSALLREKRCPPPPGAWHRNIALSLRMGADLSMVLRSYTRLGQV